MPESSNEVSLFLEKLCTGFEQDNDSTIRQKWLFIVLSWLWNNRASFEDPLSEVEIIYADFDYPAEIEGFVKYMPPSDGYDPSTHSQTENMNHLMENWVNYLEEKFVEYKK